MASSTKKRRGWILFALGLATCAVAGAVAGTMAARDGEDGSGEARRVAALALDTRRLNEDALALSRSIEEALEREELEDEAEALRAGLATVERRAARIRARVRSQLAADRRRAPGGGRASGSEGRRARKGLREVEAALAVFDRTVVSRLGSVISSGASPGGGADVALAEAKAVLVRQGEAMARLSRDLVGPDAAEAEGPKALDGAGASAAGVVAGSFEAAPASGGAPLTVEYELDAIDAATGGAGAAPGRAAVTASAAGRLAIARERGDAGAAANAPAALLAVLYWEERDAPAAAATAELRLGPPAERDDEARGGGEPAAPEPAEPCRYERDGVVYCAFAAFLFGEPGGGVAPGAEPELGGPRPYGSVVIDRDGAEELARLIGERPPALVEIREVGEPTSESVLRAACVAGEAGGDGEARGGAPQEATGPATASGEDPQGGTVGLLDGDGTVLFEGGGTGGPAGGARSASDVPGERDGYAAGAGGVGESAPPSCYEVVRG